MKMQNNTTKKPLNQNRMSNIGKSRKNSKCGSVSNHTNK